MERSNGCCRLDCHVQGWCDERLTHDLRVALGPSCCVASPIQLSFGKPSTMSDSMDRLTVVLRPKQDTIHKQISSKFPLETSSWHISMTRGWEAKRAATEPSKPQPMIYRKTRDDVRDTPSNTTDTTKGDPDQFASEAPLHCVPTQDKKRLGSRCYPRNVISTMEPCQRVLSRIVARGESAGGLTKPNPALPTMKFDMMTDIVN